MAGPGGKAGFFGGLIEGVGNSFVERKKEQHKEEQDNIKRQFDAGMLLFDKGFEDIGATLLGHTISSQFQGPKDAKGKPQKAKSPIQAFLQNPMAIGGLLKGLHKGIGGKDDKSSNDAGTDAEGAGAPKGEDGQPPAKSPFRSREEGEKVAEDQYRSRKKFDTDEGVRAAQEEGRYNKQPRGRFVPGTTKGSELKDIETDTFGNKIDPNKSYKIRQTDDGGTPEAIPIEGKAGAKDNSPQGRLATRIKTLHPDLAPEEAQKQAAQRLEDQDKLTGEQKKGRYDAFMKASENASSLSTERLKEMKTLYPLHVAAAEAKADNDAFRAALAGQKTSQNAMKAIQAAQKMAAKIVEKRGILSEISSWFGGVPTDEELVDGFLKEAGQDPEVVRELAQKAFVTPDRAPIKPVASHEPTKSSSAPGAFKKDAAGNYVISSDAAAP